MTDKTALLLIDIQQGLVDAPEELHQADIIIARCADLLQRARAAGTPVFHMQHDGGPGDDLERLTPGWRLHGAVAPTDGEKVIEKSTSSGFVGGELDQRLRAAGITRLVIAGLQTDFCIDTNCRVACNLGYEVILATDAHSTYDGSGLTAAQIIAHHNRILGTSSVTPRAAADIAF